MKRIITLIVIVLISTTYVLAQQRKITGKIIDSDTKEGFFSSNRNGGKGSDDIYAINEVKPLIVEDCMQFIAGVITDMDTKLPIEGAEVAILDLDANKDLQNMVVGADGVFKFTVDCDKKYAVKAFKKNYTDDERTLALKKERNKVNDASMQLRTFAKIEEEKLIAENEKRKAEKEAKEKADEEERLKAEQQKKEKEAKKQEKIKELLDALGIIMPLALPHKDINVDTRKKLSNRRKRNIVK